MIYIYINDNDLISMSDDNDFLSDFGFVILDIIEDEEEFVDYIRKYYNMSYKNAIKYIKELRNRN